ncbi:hypothetical protein CesoFtcFv8_013403 [Champsocephalus esox]|uniref:BEN domain-containing protein n=1 Tax=Champsocephalus esox TaxID=159716 RepID=A0AAN8BQE0_9TELE|nr:hypothetical protein CesoFtcFv8_013403 [Champsocephalus esox]
MVQTAEEQVEMGVGGKREAKRGSERRGRECGGAEKKAQLEQDYLEGRQHEPAAHSDSETDYSDTDYSDTDSETEPVEWRPLSTSVTKSKPGVNGSAAPRREASGQDRNRLQIKKTVGATNAAASAPLPPDGSLADHDRKRIRQLEQTVKAMEKSYRSLKRRMRTLEDAGAPAKRPAAGDAAPAEEMCNGQTVTSLEASVSHLAAGEKDLLEVVKILALRVFSADELRTHSLTGKKTCKVTPSDPRPALDQARFRQLEQQVRKRCGVSHSTFMGKVQNLQKALRKKPAAEEGGPSLPPSWGRTSGPSWVQRERLETPDCQ